MELVTDEFKTSMHRVLIIHALAECIGADEVVSHIESKSGKIESEGEIVRLEKEVFDKVLELRTLDQWPPK